MLEKKIKGFLAFCVYALFGNMQCEGIQYTEKMGMRGVACEINDEIKKRIVGKSWDEKDIRCPKLSDLRYLIIPFLGYDNNINLGEMILHKDLAEEVLDIFQELLLTGNVRIEKMKLIDDYFKENETRYTVKNLNEIDSRSMKDNNTSAFFFRLKTLQNELSNHALGLALDINTLENPFVKGDIVDPIEGTEYCDRTRTDVKGFITADGDCVKIFKKHGWAWGGDCFIGRQDYQHFCKEPGQK